MPARDCSKTGCSRPAVSSLTFVYEDSTVVVGPLGRTSEPNVYDLCLEHAERMTAPRGWELIRIAGDTGAVDDLVALAAAVGPHADPAPHHPAPASAAGQRERTVPGSAAHEPRHLRVVRTERD